MTVNDRLDKNKSDDRVLKLRPIDGTKAVASNGLVDPRLFKGDNSLHAIREPGGLWFMKYDAGGVPEPLKQKFTSFPKLLHHATQYFKSRNVEIYEVID